MAEGQFAFEFNAPIPGLPQLWTPDDIYDQCDQQVLESFKEDRRVERKRFEVSQRDFAAYLSMWANTQPSGGIMFIGVANDGALRGCAHGSTEHLNEFETARKLCPDAHYDLKRVPVIDVEGNENFIVVVRVYYRPDKLVETADGSAYIREGDEKRVLLEGEKREIRMNKGEIAAESERTSVAYPAGYDQQLSARFRDGYVAKRNLPARYSI